MRGTVKIILALALAALAAGFAFRLFPKNAAVRSALSERELATQVLAEYLAGQFAGQRALIISNPFTQQKGRRKEIYEFEVAGIRGLKAGLGNRIVVAAVEFPDLRAEFLQNPDSVYVDPKTTTPLSYLIADDAFDTLARKHPDCGLFVSLIGLPVNPGRTELWRRPDGPKLALLLPDLRMVGDQTAVRNAIGSKKIVAMVLNKPGAPPEGAPVEKDVQAEFARRYVLVTSENIDEVIRTYPRLF